MTKTAPSSILHDVRRTDKTLTLISKQDDGTHEFNCGLGDTFYYGLQLVSVGNSLDSGSLTHIALICRDEFGTFYHYEVQTNQPGKFLPLLQKPRQYPVLDKYLQAKAEVQIAIAPSSSSARVMALRRSLRVL